MKHWNILWVCWIALYGVTAFAEEPVAPIPEPAPPVVDEPQAEPAPAVAEEPQAEPTPVVAEEPQAEPAPAAAEEPQAELAPAVAEEPQAEPAPAVAEEPEPIELTKEKPPVMDPATKTCYDSCDCWREFGGGEVVVGMIFPEIQSAWGEMSGTMMMIGGRGYGYLLDNQLRIGGMGMAMLKEDTADQITQRYYRTETGRLPHISDRRSATGGYGGLTVEYVFHLDEYVHFPVGTLVGFGGGSFDSVMRQSPAGGLEAVNSDGNWMFVLQPMAQINVSALEWLRLGVGFFYLWADPINSEADFSSPGVMLSLGFGHFFEKPFKLKSAEALPAEQETTSDDPLTQAE